MTDLPLPLGPTLSETSDQHSDDHADFGPPATFRVDMCQAIKQPLEEFIPHLVAILRLEIGFESRLSHLGEELKAGKTSKAIAAIRIAEFAREAGKDVFLDFGASLEEFLPASFVPLEQNGLPSQRFVNLSELAKQSDVEFVERCLCCLLGQDEAGMASVNYYVERLEFGQMTRLDVIADLLSQSRLAGVRCWIDLDLIGPQLRAALKLTGSKGEITGRPEDGVVDIGCASTLFTTGWYPTEVDRGIQFRWMSQRGLIRNPYPETPLIGLELFIEHVYGADSPVFECRLDKQELNVSVGPSANSRFFGKASITDMGASSLCSYILLESLAFGSPAESPELGDDRVLSFAISSVRLYYS